MKSRERKKIHPTSQKRMRKVRNGRDLKMRKVVSELSTVWTPFKTKEKRKRNSYSDIVDEFDINMDNRKRNEKIDKGNSIKYFDILKDSESQEDLGKSQLEIQPNTENKSSELKSKTLPQSKGTDNDNVILTAKKNNDHEFMCIVCDKSFLSKHNLKVHDKRFHTKPGSESTYNCDNCNFTCIEKGKLAYHIPEKHEKCKVCTKVFHNRKSLDTHIEAVHKKPILKHSIEREHSLKN